MVIKRVGPVSCAKIAAVLYAMLGLIFGAFMSLIGLAGGLASGEEGGAMFGALFGVGAIIFMPIIYGVMGFIGALIMAFLYNVGAGMAGGVEIDVQ